MKTTVFLFVAILSAMAVQAQSYNLNRALEAFTAKEFDKAIDYLNRNLNDQPKSAETYYYRAYCNFYLSKNALAITDANTALNFATAKQSLIKANLYELRAKIYVSIDDKEKAIADYGKAMNFNPKDPDFYVGRGQTHFDLKQYDKAETDYKQVLKLAEGDERGWVGLGCTYFSQKRFAEANKILTQLTKLSPEYADGFYFRANASFALENYAEAIRSIFRALELDQTNERGKSCFLEYATKNYPLALSILNAKINDNPTVGFWYFIRGQLYDQQSNYTTALSDYSKAVELWDHRNLNDLLSARAQCYTGAGFYKEAIADFDKVLAADSTRVYDCAFRADALRLMGNYPEAVIGFTKAIALEPRESWFYYRRGWVLDEFMKQYAAGLKDYNQAIMLDKNYPYTYLK